MKVILLQDVKKQGKKDEIIEVSEGYANNFLIKNGLALPANEGNKKQLNKQLEQRKQDEDALIKSCEELKEKLEQVTLEFFVKTGNDGRIFGNVSSKQICDELKNKGIESSKDFAILTNILTNVWSGYSVKEYKELKNLKKENLRDNMTNMELVLNMLAEVSSTEISKSSDDKGYSSVKKSIVKGGNVAKTAKEQIEKETGKKIVNSTNHKNIKQIDNN